MYLLSTFLNNRIKTSYTYFNKKNRTNWRRIMEILDTFSAQKLKRNWIYCVCCTIKTLFVLKHLVNCYKWIDVQSINTTNP